jgi:hypothetical protein
MYLASLEDVNTHLQEDVIKATDADVALIQLDIVRTVKGMLTGTYSPTTLAEWVDPDSTPTFIRSIAGRLIAAKYYARKLSANQVELPEYAQWLYDSAIADLTKVIDGTVTLEDVDEVVNTGNRLTEDMFNFPEEPKITMSGKEF